MTRKADGLKLLESSFSAALETSVLGRTTWFSVQDGSTNDTARAWALETDQAPHGALVFTELQTRGRGRHGRDWEAQAGLNLMFSLVLRPDLPASDFPMLTLAAGKAVRAALDEAAPGVRPLIKWPNDVLMSGRKCSGILLESSIGTGVEGNFVILGIGVNVNQASFDADIVDSATSLILETGRPQDRGHLLARILGFLESELDLLASDRARFLSEYEAVMAGVGRSVNWGREWKAGVICGISEDGALRLSSPTGEELLYAGEFTFEYQQGENDENEAHF